VYLKKHELQVTEKGLYSPLPKIAASSWGKIFRTGFPVRQRQVHASPLHQNETLLFAFCHAKDMKQKMFSAGQHRKVIHRAG
jgi:hypothetical protein